MRRTLSGTAPAWVRARVAIMVTTREKMMDLNCIFKGRVCGVI